MNNPSNTLQFYKHHTDPAGNSFFLKGDAMVVR